MTNTPLAESLHIAIAGLINSGKSSLMNNLFEKPVVIVSDEPGTTTDPVTKRIELSGAGACAVTDTAGIDDSGELGSMRVQQTLERIATSDILVLVTRADKAPSNHETDLADSFLKSGRKLICAATFADCESNNEKTEWLKKYGYVSIDNSSAKGIDELKKKIISIAASATVEITPLEGLVHENDSILLVTPVDLAAPKGRLILPQIETIRDALDRDCAVTIVKERELYESYQNMKKKPSLVITDSQSFSKTAADIDPDQKLTSFSILFARKKGDLPQYVRGTKALDRFTSGSRALIVESCSHHRQPDDIGTVKIPRLLRQIVQSDIEIEFTHGIETGKDYSRFSIAVFCGGCMRTRREMLRMTSFLEEQGVPVTNYGLFLAWANGLLPRALEVFEHEHSLYISS